MDKPSGVGSTSRGDSYRPGAYQGNDRRRAPRARGGLFRGRGRGGYQKIIPAERELLRTRRDGVDENLVNEEGAGVVYRDINDLSDDEEADMEISDNSDDDDEESGEPSSKRARHAGNDESGNSVPKWSNPDPYTALPPPDAAERKKKDMVKMIRKARVDETAADKLKASTEAEEFISFDFDEPNDEEEIILPPSEPPSPSPPPPPGPAPPLQSSSIASRTAPSGPRSDRPPAINGSAVSTAPSTPGKPSTLPPRPAASNDALGSRKRTVDDHIKPPTYAPLKKVNKMPVGGAILPEWKVTKGEDPTPWIDADHSKTSDISVW